jgi:Na+/proline symporter
MQNQLSPLIIITIIVGYFILLMGISWWASRDSKNESFFVANREAPWYLVAIGMIGASISGVTFISVPGWVKASQFGYMQVVLGYWVGYMIIIGVLLPLYYRLNLISIYTYLERRFGRNAYKIGSAYFLLSRTLGTALRVYLVTLVLHQFIFAAYNIPFIVTVASTLFLIWLYTYRSGVKTIIYTDTILTFFFLTAVCLTIVIIGRELNLHSVGDYVAKVRASEYSQMFNMDWKSDNYFLKQFFSGIVITVCMTGLDQDIMQKNLTCKNIGEAQKNMFYFSFVLVFVNLLFLSLGVYLYEFAALKGIQVPAKTDELYPMIALQHVSPLVAILFVVGVTASAFSSSDSALTALTTAFCIDFLDFEKKNVEGTRQRTLVHVGFCVLMVIIIVIVRYLNDESIIKQVLKIGGYTYGPLLGLFTFGLFTNRVIDNKLVIPVCLAAPILSYILDANSAAWFGGFKIGFMVLALNGLITFLGLWAISKKGEAIIL